MTPPPEYPFQQVVCDLFYVGSNHYIAYAFRLSGWLEIAQLKMTATSSDIIEILREFFHRFGVPEEISTDGGPNIHSKEVIAFWKKMGVSHRLSSAYYPQSNGRAEAAVKSAKRIVRANVGKPDEIARCLSQHRNTPMKGCKVSPAQLVMGRDLRDFIPQPQDSGYRVSNRWKEFLRQREQYMLKNNDKIVEQKKS